MIVPLKCQICDAELGTVELPDDSPTWRIAIATNGAQCSTHLED